MAELGPVACGEGRWDEQGNISLFLRFRGADGPYTGPSFVKCPWAGGGGPPGLGIAPPLASAGNGAESTPNLVHTARI